MKRTDPSYFRAVFSGRIIQSADIITPQIFVKNDDFPLDFPAPT
jgi:hypothetical protein